MKFFDARLRARRAMCSAFALVELVVVVLILGILAAVALPAVFGSSEDAAINAMMQDFRAIEEAAIRYRTQNGDWPAWTYKNNAPGEFDGYIHPAVFRKQPPIETWSGYGYVWHPDVFGTDRAIYVHNPNPPTELWLELDERFDDGDPEAGDLYIYSNLWLIYTVDKD